MKKLFTLSTLFFLAVSFLAAQSPVGVWRTIDDETGKAKSHIEIYEQDGAYFGKVVKILTDKQDAVCDQCDDERKDQPVMNMVILTDLRPYKDYWSYGRILDPNNGKVYKCSVWAEGDDKLKLRGYIGISALGRNQIWERVN